MHEEYLLTVILLDAFFGGEWKRDPRYTTIWNLKYPLTSTTRRYIARVNVVGTPYDPTCINVRSLCFIKRDCKETDGAAYIAELGGCQE